MRGAAVRQGNLGCNQVIANKQVVRLPDQTRQRPKDPNTTKTPWKLHPDASEMPPGIDQNKLETAISQAFQELTPSAPKRTRAIVVVKDGWVVAEHYAVGIRPKTPLIGWSMTKA